MAKTITATIYECDECGEEKLIPATDRVILASVLFESGWIVDRDRVFCSRDCHRVATIPPTNLQRRNASSGAVFFTNDDGSIGSW